MSQPVAHEDGILLHTRGDVDQTAGADWAIRTEGNKNEVVFGTCSFLVKGSSTTTRLQFAQDFTAGAKSVLTIGAGVSAILGGSVELVEGVQVEICSLRRIVKSPEEFRSVKLLRRRGDEECVSLRKLDLVASDMVVTLASRQETVEGLCRTSVGTGDVTVRKSLSLKVGASDVSPDVRTKFQEHRDAFQGAEDSLKDAGKKLGDLKDAASDAFGKDRESEEEKSESEPEPEAAPSSSSPAPITIEATGPIRVTSEKTVQIDAPDGLTIRVGSASFRFTKEGFAVGNHVLKV